MSVSAIRRLRSLRSRHVVLTVAFALAAFAACFAGGAALAGDEAVRTEPPATRSVAVLSEVADLPALRADPAVVARERAARRRAARARAVAARKRAAARRAAREAAAAPAAPPAPATAPEPAVAAPVPVQVPQAPAPTPEPAPAPEPPTVFDDSG